MGLKQTRRIIVRSAVGYGPTELAAFDSALRGTGTHNFNIIRLSSVIPPGCTIEIDNIGGSSGNATPGPLAETTVEGSAGTRIEGGWGDRLYAVYAEQCASHPDESVYAGVGWVQDETGRGLFVEHEGPTRYGVERDIEASLNHLVSTRGGGFGPIKMHVTGGRCRAGESVCALVIATYQTEEW